MLIVEDQDYMRNALREFLQSAYPEKTILEARDGRSGIEMCRAYHPRVVLMDIGLPDANGIELTAQIRTMMPDVAVIIVSSHTGSAYTERARIAGASAFVAKENVHSDLLPHVARALERTAAWKSTP